MSCPAFLCIFVHFCVLFVYVFRFYFKQKQIYDAMGWGVPNFAHIPLIHSELGKKLSKRGINLDHIQLYHPCHKHDLRLRSRREAGDRLPVFIFVKKGPALRHMIELRCSRGWAHHSHECER